MWVVAGCSAADDGATDQLAEMAPLAAEVPSFQEFLDSTRQTTRVGDQVIEQYVLEGDMLVPYEMAVEYYEVMYVPSDTVPKGVGVTVPRPAPLAPVFAKYNLNTFVPDIVYCFDSRISASEKPAFVAAVAAATKAWDEASGPLQFRHDSSLDGASCSTVTSDDPFLSFAVTKAPGTISQGSLPPQANRVLSLAATLGAANVLHEVGHIIGLAHESMHSKTELKCEREQFPSSVTAGAAFNDLTTAWDPQSIMQNLDTDGLAACRHTGQARAVLSSGDKLAARALYGN